MSNNMKTVVVAVQVALVMGWIGLVFQVECLDRSERVARQNLEAAQDYSRIVRWSTEDWTMKQYYNICH